MRQEDKEVDGFELERAEERKRESDLIAEDEQELHDLDGNRDVARDRSRTDVIGAAIRKILGREHLVINDLKLDRRELRALDALKTAVEGRDQEINAFVFAEDRSTLLEQALAVLQPDLVNLEQGGGVPFRELLDGVAELRVELDELQDAEAELRPREAVAAKGEAGDTDDEEDDDTSLTGPERAIEKPASSLTGPERKAEPKPPTTLGDPAEIAEAARPWWRRE